MVRLFLLFFGMMAFSGHPASAASRLMMTFDPPPMDVYVGQEAFFRVRLLDRLGAKSVEIVPSDWSDMDVFVWNKFSGAVMAEDGTQYTLNDMLFSMVPKSAGEIVFPSFCLRLRVPTLISTRDLPDNVKISDNGDVEICTPQVLMTVGKLPQSSPPLFASSEVKLFDGVEPKDTVREGSPVKRSVLLVAKGTLPAFLPDFNIDGIENCRVYKGKTERTSPNSQNGVSAALRQTIVIVPKKAGKIVLPEIKVPWLNTQTGQTETAVAPGYTLTVLPALETAAAENADDQTPEQTETSSAPQKFSRGWFAVPVLPVFFFFLFRSAKKRKERKKLIEAVRTACQNNDFGQASAAILAWAAQTFPRAGVKNLANIRTLFREKAPAFVQQLEKLEQYLYGTGRFARHIPSVGENLGKDLFAAFRQAAQIRFPKRRKKKAKLPELYPDDDGF